MTQKPLFKNRSSNCESQAIMALNIKVRQLRNYCIEIVAILNLNMSQSVRNKMFKTTVMVTNEDGRRSKFIYTSQTVRRMIREEKQS